MIASKDLQIHIIEKFLGWEPADEWITATGSKRATVNERRQQIRNLLLRYAEEVLTECDCAIAHGPGHQSISECIVTGPHTEHYSNMDHEWEDKDIGEQTYDKYNYDGPIGEYGRRTKGTFRTYRLAIAPYTW